MSSQFEETRPHDYLQRLAASGLGRAYKSLTAAELGISLGDTVLDLGCGPGADLPGFARAVGEAGRVIGIDNDSSAVLEAVSRTAGFPQADVVEGDIHALDFPDSSVDRAHTDRVLQHVADPAAVLSETRRVLRAGGCAAFAEPDWDTLIIDYPETSVARAYTRFVTDHVVRNSTIGRQLVRLAIRAGFEIRNVIPITMTFRDIRAADQVLGLWRVTDRAVRARYLTEESASRWLNHLSAEPFFASATLYIVTATPADSRILSAG